MQGTKSANIRNDKGLRFFAGKAASLLLVALLLASCGSIHVRAAGSTSRTAATAVAPAPTGVTDKGQQPKPTAQPASVSSTAVTTTASIAPKQANVAGDRLERDIQQMLDDDEGDKDFNDLQSALPPD